MIQPLRNLHRRVFLLLVIALPLFFIAGLRARHHEPAQKASPRKPVSQAPMNGSEPILTTTSNGAPSE